MSIYATLWEIKLPKAHRFDDQWATVYAQAVPPHIGHPSHYPEGDPYSDFLPPIVDCDPETGLGLVNRAVVILVEGHDEKIGQRYTEPLLTLTGEEYASIPFGILLERIEQAMPWDPDVAALSIGPKGERSVIRVPGWRTSEDGHRQRVDAILRDRRGQRES
jgi:hypothetical protein